MAKKTVDDEVRFEDIDFDSSLDLDPNNDFGQRPKTGKRAVVEEAKNSFLTNIKNDLTDKAFVRRFVGLVMPKGYSQAFNAYDGARAGIKKIYDDNESELRPYLAKSNRLLNQRKGRFKNLLPRGLRDLMESADYKESYQESSAQADDELNANLTSLNNLFKLEVSNAAEQRIEDKRKELKEDRKFQLGLETSTDTAAGIGRLVAYQDRILINYHRKNLEIGFRQFDVQRRLLLTTEAYHKDALERFDAIQKNTAMPDYVKLTTGEALKDRLRQRLADAAVSGLTKFRDEYFGNVTKAASGMLSGALGVVGLGKSMATDSGMSKEQMVGMMAGTQMASVISPKIQFMFEHIADMVAPAVAAIPGVKGTGDRLRTILTDPQGWLNRLRQSEDTGTGIGGWIKSTIKNLLPAYTPKDKIDGMELEDMQEPAIFDNFFYQTVTQTVPAYLESIDKTLRTMATGEEQDGQAWSVYTGGLVSRETLDAQHVRIGLFRGQGQNVRQEIQSLMGQLGADTLSPQARTVLGRRLLLDLQKGQGFDPLDYVKPDSWPDAEEDVANELVEFFADAFQIGVDGKYISDDRGFLADMVEAFTDSSNRIPKVLERSQALIDAGLIDRGLLRRTGITSYGGVNTDFVNAERWADVALGEDPLDAVKRDKDTGPDYKSMSLTEAFKAASEETKRQMLAKEEEDRLQRIQNQQAGGEDDIDTQFKPLGKVKKYRQRTKKSTNPTVEMDDQLIQTLNALRESSQGSIGDTGTHTRLDKILEKMDNLKVSVGDVNVEAQSTKLSDLTADIIESGIDKGKKAASYGATKVKEGKDKANELIDQAKKWYKEDPKVREVVDKIESTYGNVTSPELRAKLISEVYKRTGTPDEIYKSLNKRFEQAKTYTQEKYESGKAYVTGKYDDAVDWVKEIYDDRERIKKEASDKLDQGKKYVKTKATSARDRVKDIYDKREEHYQSAKNTLSSAASRVGQMFESISFSDKGTHRRLDVNNKLLYALLKNSGWEGQLESLNLDAPAEEKKGPGLFRKMVGGVAKGVASIGEMGVKAAGLGVKAAGFGIRTAGSLVSGTYGALLGNKTWGVRDVMVAGEDKPRLRAVDIRGGFYQDKNSGKIITGLKDITGAVIDVRTGNEVISQEEFDDKKLVDGKGESLVGMLGRRAGSLALKAGGIGVTAVAALYGGAGVLAFKVAKAAIGMAIDQFTQFDAYFPGESTPRIRSKLLKKGHYRDEKGAPIMSLKDIKGVVYDIDGNVVISKEDMEKYKSLYSRNNSLLFTFGRGMAKASSLLARTAFNTIVRPGLKAAAAIIKAPVKMMRWAGKKALSLFKGKSKPGEDPTQLGELSSSILMEQLQIQRQILDQMSKSDKVKNDGDGDGIRDNSWADIMMRRNKRKARGANADVVEAIDSLGARLDNTFKTMNEAVKKLRGDDKGLLGNAWDKLKNGGGALLGGIGTKLGLDSLAGKGFLGGAKHIAKSGLKFMGKGLFSAAKFAVQRLAVPAIVGAAKLAGAAVAAVGWPVVLAGVAVGFIAYKGYQYFKQYKFDQKPLHFLRMYQYGVKASDEERVEKILQLETYLGNAIQGIDTEQPDFDNKKIDMRKIYEIFGLLKPAQEGEEPDDSELDQERAEQLHQWLAYRFKPVYLKHIRALNKLAKVKDLNKADESITTKDDMLMFLDQVTIPNGREIYDQRKMSPFDGRLSMDADDVTKAFTRCRELAEKMPSKDKVTVADEEVPTSEIGGQKDTSSEIGGQKDTSIKDTGKSDTSIKDLGKSDTSIKDLGKSNTSTETTSTSAETADTSTVAASASTVAASASTVAASTVQKSGDRQKDTAPVDGLATSAATTAAIVKRSEQHTAQLMKANLDTGNQLLQKQLEKLTTIDSTLATIRDTVTKMANKPAERKPVEVTSVPGHETPKETTTAPKSPEPAEFVDRARRGNGSNRRAMAVN